MKALTVMILLQTGVLLFLLGKVVAIEKGMPVAEYKDQSALASGVFDVLPADAYSRASYSYPDEIQLRHIIREELDAALDDRSGPDRQVVADTAPNETNKDEKQYQRDMVARQLEYHTSVRSISDADMQKLQWDIAKLDEAGRKEMLGKLTRAMNSGDLEGRL